MTRMGVEGRTPLWTPAEQGHWPIPVRETMAYPALSESLAASSQSSSAKRSSEAVSDDNIQSWGQSREVGLAAAVSDLIMICCVVRYDDELRLVNTRCPTPPAAQLTANRAGQLSTEAWRRITWQDSSWEVTVVSCQISPSFR